MEVKLFTRRSKRLWSTVPINLFLVCSISSSRAGGCDSLRPETLHLVCLLKTDGCVLTEESCGVGLPLGVEYERKKQRLQQELRMDYRRYMAQVTVGLLPVCTCA